MRAIGYFRSGDEVEGSLSEMERAFTEFCNINLHQPIKTFGGVGLDEVGALSEYQRMIGFVRESGGGFLVVVPDARHLGSDLESVVRSLVEIEALGADVACHDEDFPDPLQNALQAFGVRGLSRAHSQRVRESMRLRASQGRALGRPLYGYSIGPDGRLQAVVEEAATVALIYRLYTKENLGLRLITQHMNERDILTRTGGQWSIAGVRGVLRNPSYMGTSTRFDMRVPRAHEAIVTPEAFRAAQDIARARRPRGRSSRQGPFLLSGIAFCGYCSNKMMGITRRRSWRHRDGRQRRQTYRYYQCQSKNNQGLCRYHTWKASVLEDLVLRRIRCEPDRVTANAVGPDGEGSYGVEARVVENERVRNAERRFLHALRRAARGRIGTKALVDYLDDLDDTRRAREGSGHPLNIASTLDNWEALDIGARRAFLAESVDRVVVRDEGIDVVARPLAGR